MTENFDAKAALIGELFAQQTRDAQKIHDLQRENDDMFRTIALLIATLGTPDSLSPGRRVVRLSYDDMLSSPSVVFRWDYPDSGEVCLGVKLDGR